MKKLIEYFINKPLLVNLLTILILASGFISLRSINREGYPHVDWKILTITTIYPGASPEDIELSITIPIEDELKVLDGIKEFSSKSVENQSYIRIVLEEDLKDMEKIKNDIRRAIDNIDLPPEVVKRPYIYERKVSNIPVLEIGIFSETLSYSELRRRAIDFEKKLKKLPVISKVVMRGIRDREFKITLNLNKLDKNYISIEEVINSIKTHNIEITGGTLKDKNFDKMITVFAKLKSIDDIKNIIVRSTFEGNNIYMKDIADIKDSFEEETRRMRFNGKKGISILPKKKKSADVIKTTDLIKEKVIEYKKSLENEDIDFVYLWDLSKDTRIRLKIVQTNAIIGLFLVLLVLFVFMNLRNAIWTALGIPFSVAFAMIILKLFFDITINSVSLLGVIIVMGMVVDDAIIVSENIFRHRLLGEKWKDAAYNATAEVAYPVITTIATTMVAFLPMYNLTGIIGDFAKEIPLVVSFILLGSLIESLFILPNHVSHTINPETSPKVPKEKEFIKIFRDVYQKILSKMLVNYYWVILIFFIILGISAFILFSGKVIKYDKFPAEETKAMYISGQIKYGQSLDFTEKRVRLIEEKVRSYPDNVVVSYASSIGEAGYPENFFMEIYLTHFSERDIKADDIIIDLRTLVSNCGKFTNVTYKKESGGPPEGRDIEIEIVGNDNQKRKDISDKIFTYLSKIMGTRDIMRSDLLNKKEIKVIVNQEKAARLGVSPLSIGNTIRAAYNGVIATDIQTPEELIEYRVILEEKYRKNIRTLYNLKVPNRQNNLIPLSQMINHREENSINKIDHYNGDRTTRISADLDKKIITPKEIYDRIKKDFKNFELENPGFDLIIAGEAKESIESINSIISASIVAISLIFFMLIMLFKSLTQSLVALLAIPFSFIGITLALLTHNMPLSFMALLGTLGLAGVVVNDSLVMVSYINSLKDKSSKSSNFDIKKIICEGAATRLRPIILTSITTIAGLLPTCYGIGGKDPMTVPTVIVMAWGLFFSTTLTLFLIPSLYLAEYKISRFTTNETKRLFNYIKESFKSIG